jgi:hypothetical protein
MKVLLGAVSYFVVVGAVGWKGWFRKEVTWNYSGGMATKQANLSISLVADKELGGAGT